MSLGPEKIILILVVALIVFGPQRLPEIARQVGAMMRELRQSARLQRTPVILMAVTVAVALLICSVGGIASVTAEPAKVGVGVFHTFFSLAFALVTWLGPAVASSTRTM